MFDEIFTKPTRRGFLGSIIGTIITTKLSFIAQAAMKDSFGDTYYERIERLLYLEQEDFLKFKGLVHTLEGGQIWAPPMLSYTNGVFEYGKIEVNQKVMTDSTTLIDDEGYVLGVGLFNNLVSVYNGDVLNVSFSNTPLYKIKLAIKQPDFEMNGKIITPKTKAMKVI